MSEREQEDSSEAEGHDSKMLFGPLDVDEQSKAQPYDVVLLLPSNSQATIYMLRYWSFEDLCQMTEVKRE